jgi:Tol biopolymer transport system component
VRVDCHPVIRDRILFHTHVEGGLHAVHPDGHSLVEVAPPGTFRGGEMSLSPDGSRLAWAHGVGVDARKGMTIMFVDGVVIAEVFADRQVTHPSWSRDGAMIVADDFANILAVGADGTGPRVVRPGREPDLLRAGGPLVFSTGGMRVAATLTGPDTPVGGSGAIPRWSPDGSQVVFLRIAAPEGRFQMFTMRADGSGLRQLTWFRFGLGAPTWSPDGSRIAFGGDNNIWIAAPAGAGTLHRMDLPPLASLPMWSQVP